MKPETINPNSAVPMYRQISSILSEKITEGELVPGDRLPTELDLAQEYNVSRITVRAAIKELEDDGLVQRAQGKGTFVCKTKDPYFLRQGDDLYGFTHACQMSGKEPKTELITMDYVLPSKKIQTFLNLSSGEKALFSSRLRYADNVPILIEYNYFIPTLSFLFDENLNGSLFSVLNKHGYLVCTKMRNLEICCPTKEEASLLQIKPASPLLLFTDQQTSSDGSPLYVSKQLYCTEKLTFFL